MCFIFIFIYLFFFLQNDHWPLLRKLSKVFRLLLFLLLFIQFFYFYFLTFVCLKPIFLHPMFGRFSFLNMLKHKVLWALGALVEVLIDVFWFWKLKFQEYLTRSDGTSGLKRRLQTAQTYEEWEKYAYKLDSQLGNDLW